MKVDQLKGEAVVELDLDHPIATLINTKNPTQYNIPAPNSHPI